MNQVIMRCNEEKNYTNEIGKSVSFILTQKKDYQEHYDKGKNIDITKNRKLKEMRISRKKNKPNFNPLDVIEHF